MCTVGQWYCKRSGWFRAAAAPLTTDEKHNRGFGRSSYSAHCARDPRGHCEGEKYGG